MLAALMVAPCPSRSTVLPLSAGSAPQGAPDITAYAALAEAETPDLVRGVARLLAQTFRVPLPPHVVLRLHATRASLARDLARDVGLAPRAALELAGTAIGVALPRTVLLLIDEDPDDRVRLVAHEMMHLVQHELAGEVARPAQWIMEGTAEWAALMLLDRLGAAGIRERRHAALAAARTYLSTHPDFAPAHARRATEFRRWQRTAGSRVAYQVAYALADRLVARYGMPAVIEYFRAFRQNPDAAANFERAFGVTSARFVADARAALAIAARSRDS